MGPKGSYILMLSYRGVELFEKIWRYGFVGKGMPLNLEVSKAQASPSLSLSLPTDQDVVLITSPELCLPRVSGSQY